MVEKLNNTSFYVAAVTGGQKKRLFAAYKEYISLVRNIENVISLHSISHLAAHKGNTLFPNGTDDNPWTTYKINTEDKKVYQDFIHNINVDDKKYCFVNLELSTVESSSKEIIAAPEEYDIHTKSNNLPHRIERYSIAYPKKTKLNDARFVIDGKHILVYENPEDDMLIADAFNDELIENRFMCMLGLLSRLPENIQDVEEKELKDAQNETLASELSAPFENIILSSLATLTEEATRTIKDILSVKKGDNYLSLAEKRSFIPSASRFQDYQNIRHLIHHQWDTLDNIGYFTYYDADRNVSVRKRFIEAYGRICNKPLKERVKAYRTVTADFVPLVTGLIPGLMIREQNESNHKFVTRIKAYAKEHPDQELLIETSYVENKDKKHALIKNIEKLFPKAEIIDRKELDMTNFMDRIKQHMARNKFLELISDIEYKICEYYLFEGISQPANKCWQDLVRKKMISVEEAEEWENFKKLRNEISHHHMPPEMAEKIEENLIPLAMASYKLCHLLKEKSPTIYLVDGTVYRAVHTNGKVVDIDIKNKTVISITDASGKDKTKTGWKKAENNTIYTEEHRNGVNITLKGTTITAFRMPDGTIIDLRARKIINKDNSTFYFNSEDHNCLTFKDGKILTDKKFQIKNYIHKGRSIQIEKNEILVLPNNSKLKTNRDLSIASVMWQDETAQTKQIITYEGHKDIPYIRFTDGTTIYLKKNGPVISHKGIELNYHNRQAFVDSYDETPPPPQASKNKHR